LFEALHQWPADYFSSDVVDHVHGSLLVEYVALPSSSSIKVMVAADGRVVRFVDLAVPEGTTTESGPALFQTSLENQADIFADALARLDATRPKAQAIFDGEAGEGTLEVYDAYLTEIDPDWEPIDVSRLGVAESARRLVSRYIDLRQERAADEILGDDAG
jgi:hypothetical protein